VKLRQALKDVIDRDGILLVLRGASDVSAAVDIPGSFDDAVGLSSELRLFRSISATAKIQYQRPSTAPLDSCTSGSMRRTTERELLKQCHAP